MRGRVIAAGILGLGALLFAATVVDLAVRGPAHARVRHAAMRLVGELGLSDLCLFTEARYTRHPSQADFHSAFQDHPLSLEHFPSGSIIGPPPTVIGNHAHLAGKTVLSD